jgi:hypothetical protein
MNHTTPLRLERRPLSHRTGEVNPFQYYRLDKEIFFFLRHRSALAPQYCLGHSAANPDVLIIHGCCNPSLPDHLFSEHYIAYQAYPKQRTKNSEQIPVLSIEGHLTPPQVYLPC